VAETSHISSEMGKSTDDGTETKMKGDSKPSDKDLDLDKAIQNLMNNQPRLITIDSFDKVRAQ
jgi:hypothetical protein